MRFIVFSILFFFCTVLIAQQAVSLTVYGKVKHKKSILNEVNIEVYKDNELQKQLTNLKNGSFKLTLPIGSVYNVSFKKDEFVYKSLAVIARTDSHNIKW